MIVFNYFLTAIIWVISIMPFWILYGVSDFMFVVIYYLVGYRKKVVYANLRNSFPDKSEKEIKQIAHKFYHNLCDLFLEVIKVKTISQKKLVKKLRFKNIEIIWADLDHVGGTKLRENSMDAIIAANVFFQLEQKDNACTEIKRILKPGGRVLFVDWVSSFGGIGPQPQSVVPESEAKKLFEKHGFTEDRFIDAGAHHYGIIFRKV